MWFFKKKKKRYIPEFSELINKICKNEYVSQDEAILSLAVQVVGLTNEVNKLKTKLEKITK